MELKPGYKQTEVGVIPEKWDVATLSEVCRSITDGTHYTPRYVQIGVPFYSVENITADNFTDTKFISEAAHSILARRCRPERGDILLTRIGALGDTKLLNWDVRASIYVSLALLKLNDRAVPEFVYSYTKSSRFVRDVERRSLLNAAPKKINMGDIGGIPIPLPRMKSEQAAIAAALGDVDALTGALDRLIAKKRDLKQAAMQQLLTGRTRLPGFSGEWASRELRSFVREFVVPMRDKPKRFSGDIPWCRIEDFEGKYLNGSKSGQYVDEQTVKEMNLKVCPAGTLLVSCSADLGRCAIVTRPLVTNQTFIGLVLDDVAASNEFMYYYMTYGAGQLNTLSSGTTISYLAREQFEVFRVFVPSTKSEQTAIATVLSDMDTEIVALEARRDKTRTVKQGMMQELLTGRIRLV
jgi:type I restriction enzyme S subunit